MGMWECINILTYQYTQPLLQGGVMYLKTAVLTFKQLSFLQQISEYKGVNLLDIHSTSDYSDQPSQVLSIYSIYIPSPITKY